jgi:two-component system, OmpR family, KDP operon response regulator KdpE
VAHEESVRILVVDDDEQMRRSLKAVLSVAGHHVTTAMDGVEALQIVASDPPELVITDLSMPGMDGYELCRRLRKWSMLPILVLSVHDGVTDKVEALDVGADDYLTKPFPIGELRARIRALMRRSRLHDISQPAITVGSLMLDFAHRRVTVAEQEITLTPKEYDILAELAKHADCVVTSNSLMEEIWGTGYDEVQTLRVHVSNLRKKLGLEDGEGHRIVTEPGIGFRFLTE